MDKLEEKSIYQMLKKSAEDYADIKALVYGTDSVTYKELFRKVTGLASFYREKGYSTKKVDLVPLLSAEWIIVFLALQVAGATVILHDPSMNVKEHIKDISFSEDAKEIYKEIKITDTKMTPAGEDSLALIIFTSGTSGKQKGVVLTQKNLVSDAVMSSVCIGKGALLPGQNSIPVLPLFHLFGVTASILAPLYVGLTLHILPDMKYLIKNMSEIKPRILFVVPMIAKTMLKKAEMMRSKGLKPKDIKQNLFGGLDILVSGGAFLDESLIDSFGCYGVELLNGYGITECSPVVTTSSYGNIIKGSVGKVNHLPGVEVSIIDATVHISGEIVMQGYYGEKNSAFKYISGKKWFDTGDIGRIDGESNLFINGRKSNLIILDDGNNTYPEEIEIKFEKYEFINDVMVFEDKQDGVQCICAMILPDYDSPMQEEELHKKVAESVAEVNKNLPAYKRITFWKLKKNDFKRTGLKKIIRTEVNKYD